MNTMYLTLQEARDALDTAIKQNYIDMVMTGEEIRQCEHALQSIYKSLREYEARL